MTPAMEDDTPEWESFDKADSEMFGLSGPERYQATVHADDVLGYFTGRGESEVLVDPAHLRNVELIEVSDELPE